jgi:hypothetical protein
MFDACSGRQTIYRESSMFVVRTVYAGQPGSRRSIAPFSASMLARPRSGRDSLGSGSSHLIAARRLSAGARVIGLWSASVDRACQKLARNRAARGLTAHHGSLRHDGVHLR